MRRFLAPPKRIDRTKDRNPREQIAAEVLAGTAYGSTAVRVQAFVRQAVPGLHDQPVGGD